MVGGGEERIKKKGYREKGRGKGKKRKREKEKKGKREKGKRRKRDKKGKRENLFLSDSFGSNRKGKGKKRFICTF